MSAPTHMHGAILEALPASAGLDPPQCMTEFNVNARDYGTGIKAHEFLETDRTLRVKVKLLANMLRTSSSTLAYTGAGISTAAGIDDYATKAKKNSLTAAGRPVVKDWKLATPTLTHYALAALHRHGMLHHWINQNHDSLPQKASYPQHALNEIHGSLHDIANSIVPFEGTLRDDLFAWMEEWIDRAQLCLALGTSMSGFNCDRVPCTIGQRFFEDDVLGSDANATADNSVAAAIGRGLVIVNLQETQYDGLAALRIYAKTDDVFAMLADELGLQAELECAQKETYRVPDWISAAATEAAKVSGAEEAAEEADLFYFQTPGEKATMTRWDLRMGARVRLTGGPYEGDEGVVVAKCAQGHYKVRFSESIHPIFNVRRRTFSLWLGSWWIEMAMTGRGIVPGGKLPFVNVPRGEVGQDAKEDDGRQEQREEPQPREPAPATKWIFNGETWEKIDSTVLTN